MNPKERLLGAVADLQRFVIHHPDQARCPVCPRWDELQGAAMQAVTAIDDHEAELAALRAELVSIPDELADRFHCLAHAHNHRWHEALCSAVFQLERAEKAEAERESAHAAQRHAEKELAQYMAWYAMAEHQHLHEQRRAERAEQEAAGLRAALEAITRRAPIMGSTGPYREGQLDALEACREIASAALGKR